jgi:hypothetical protein
MSGALVGHVRQQERPQGRGQLFRIRAAFGTRSFHGTFFLFWLIAADSCETDFFERRVSAYQVAVQREICFDASF